MRLAYADRDKYLADPDFVRVPVAGLIDPAYLAQPLGADLARPRRSRTVARRHARRAPRSRCAPAPQPERGTSHFVAVDRWGDVASQTSTIESSLRLGADGQRLLSQQRADRLQLRRPRRTACPVANRVEGGKRPRSSMAPTIVYGPDGHVRLAVGAAGGATIIAQVAKAIIGVIDWHCRAQEAIALPMHLRARATPSIVEQRHVPRSDDPRSCRRSATRGRSRVRRASRPMRSNGRTAAGSAAADPRSEGAAVAE